MSGESPGEPAAGVAPGRPGGARPRLRPLTVATLLVVVLLGPSSVGAAPSSPVLVVVNKRSPVSVRVGEYYAAKRSLPARNLCRLAVTPQEAISRQVYEDEIAQPVLACLRDRGLTESILYIVTTKGVPLKIEGAVGWQGEAAAVDSELTLLYQRLQSKDFELAGPVPNPFYQKVGSPFGHPEFPIYLVTRLTGYDFEDIRGMMDRSLQGKNDGRFVIDLKGHDGTGGDRWLRAAAEILPRNRVLLEESEAVVYDADGVIGYASWGSNDPRRLRERRRWLGFRWLPGAIVTDFVSSNGRTFDQPPDSWAFTTWDDKENFFGGSPQSLTADYIHEGATGASGHVYEPFLELTPRPQYLLAAYYSGRNLAESYYVAMPALSWMNVVVGDPLCQIGPPREASDP